MAGLKKRFENIGSGEARLTFDPLGDEVLQMTLLPIQEVSTDSSQPRRDLGDLEDLKASIARHGIIQPLIVEPKNPHRYQLIAGERRLSAAKAIGLKVVPVISRKIEEHHRLEIQLVENLHRKDLNPVEEAEGFRRLMEEFDLPQREIAARFGRSLGSINETLRILSLPQVILQDVRTSEQTSKSVLLLIAKEPDENRQLQLWKSAQEGGLTVRKLRAEKIENEAKAKPPEVITRREFRTSAGFVSVRSSDGEELSFDRLLTALEEALLQARNERPNE